MVIPLALGSASERVHRANDDNNVEGEGLGGKDKEGPKLPTVAPFKFHFTRGWMHKNGNPNTF